MSTTTPHSTLLQEENWQDVMQQITRFPLRASEIVSLNKDITMQPISFKYNVAGSETYFNQHQQVTLKTGEYLLATQQHYCEVEIRKGEKPDLGICIDLDADLLSEALDSLFYPNQLELNTVTSPYWNESNLFMRFPSNRYFHQYMQQLFLQIKHHTLDDMRAAEMEFLRQFLWLHQTELKAFRQVPGLRKVTKTELYERMINARNYMHDHVYTLKSIPELATQVYMSEYRFYHIFKQTFDISPYQYLLQLKLEEALRLFQTEQVTWTEIAHRLAFADLSSFSKGFKKHFRITPSAYAAGFTNNIERL